MVLIGPLAIGSLVLGGISAIQSARQQGKANKLSEAAIRRARRRDRQLEPLRRQAIRSLLAIDPRAQRNLGDIFAGSSNPFSRPVGSRAREPAPNLPAATVRRRLGAGKKPKPRPLSGIAALAKRREG